MGAILSTQGRVLYPPLVFVSPTMDFTRLRNTLVQARVPLLASLLASDMECYLVGGALRDWQLGRPVSDFDFAVSADPTGLARKFAESVGGHWFMLDAERRQSRVVSRNKDALPFTYDFAPYRAEDLSGDLRLRDFTINALALPIVDGNGLPPLIDPLGGISHLQCGLLRGCSSGVFQDDPLRILKGVRHCTALGFAVDPRTLIWMREATGLLPKVAAERVRAELTGIFASDEVTRGLLLLRELGLLEALFGPCRGPGSFQQGLDALARAAQVVECLGAMDQPQWLNRELEDGLSRRTLLKMAAFLSGYEPSDPRNFFSKWRFSRSTTGLGASLVSLSPHRLEELGRLVSSRRGRALWAASLGTNPCDHLVFLPVIADAPAVLAVERILPILDDVRAVIRDGRIPDLVDGEWVRKEIGLEGEEIGRALSSLRDAEIAGRVRGVEMAKEFLKGAVRREGVRR
jgi:poly(A) polymerase